MLILSVEELRPAGRERGGWAAYLKPMTGFDVEVGLRQISAMLRSGITLLAAVETVAEEALSAGAARVWKRVAERIVRGGSFSSALAAEPKKFSELIVRLAEVGERSGELETAVSRAADQLEARRALRAQVVNALVYPAFAVAMAVGVSAFLVVAVIPKIAEFLRSGGAELPAMTTMLMDLSDWTVANGMNLLLGFAAAVAAWIAIRFNRRGHEAEDVLLLHLPVSGRILRLSGTSLFARSMHIMTESGVTLLDALATTARLVPNLRHRRRIAAAHDAVMRGLSLGEALFPAKEFTPMLRRMAAVGETTGALPETFSETARFHEMMLALAVRRFGILIEPVMIVVTGLIVGFVYVSFFMAIFALAGVG